MDKVKRLIPFDDEQLYMVRLAVKNTVSLCHSSEHNPDRWNQLLEHIAKEADSGEHCVLVELHITEVKAIIKSLGFDNFIVAKRKFEGILDWLEEHHLKENTIMIKIDHIKQVISSLKFSSVHNHFTEEERQNFNTIKKFLEATLEAVKGV